MRSGRRHKGIRRRRSSSSGGLSSLSHNNNNNMSATTSSSSAAATKQHVAVLYHCPCHDGAFAALAAYLRFKDDDAFGKRSSRHNVQPLN
jgi:hypothetical protein